MNLDVIANIERLLRSRGRSWSWLVRECNELLPDLKPTVKLSSTRCSRWNSGRGWPKPIHLAAIARVLDVPADLLLSEDPDAPIPEERTREERMLLELLRREPDPIGVDGAMSILFDTLKERAAHGRPAAKPGSEPRASELLGESVVKEKRPVGRPRAPKKPKGEPRPALPPMKVYDPKKPSPPPGDGPKEGGGEAGDDPGGGEQKPAGGGGPKGKGPRGKGPRGGKKKKA